MPSSRGHELWAGRAVASGTATGRCCAPAFNGERVLVLLAHLLGHGSTPYSYLVDASHVWFLAGQHTTAVLTDTSCLGLGGIACDPARLGHRLQACPVVDADTW